MAQITLNSTGVASNGALVLQSNGTTAAVTIDTSQRAAFVAGTAALPAITTTGDTNTGIFFPAADTIAFSEGGAECARFDSAGNLGVGTTSPSSRLEIVGVNPKLTINANDVVNGRNATLSLISGTSADPSGTCQIMYGASNSTTAGILTFVEGDGTERMRLDSSGNFIYTQSSLACYVWTAFNPTNTSGTTTNAPATGTGYDTGFVTMVNSSGTLTITFDIAGKYLVSTNLQTAHANTYSNERSIFTLGGTATTATGTQNPSFSGIDSVDANTTGTYPIYVSATAAQTITILPTYELTGTGTTAQHTCRPSVTIQYCGG